MVEIAGRIFDAQHSYELSWRIMAVAGLLGAAAIYAVASPSSFFFQAEDGIRDTSVTGVQTCALPISSRVERERHSDHHGDRDRRRAALLPRRPAPGGRLPQPGPRQPLLRHRGRHCSDRSEERRVGKECRALPWSAEWKVEQGECAQFL